MAGALCALEGADLAPPKRLAWASEGTDSEAMVTAITAAAVERKEEKVSMEMSLNEKSEGFFAFKAVR